MGIFREMRNAGITGEVRAFSEEWMKISFG
jgi:hypothetical protein